MRVDIAVIGRGLVGAAAARHLAELGHDVALIGPDEPADRVRSAGPFSSHPDEGRITRIAGRTRVWSELAARSIARYGDIAQRSGISFHSPRAVAVAVDDAAGWVQRGAGLGSDVRLVTPEWLRAETGIALQNGKPVLFEGVPSGWINPRRLVAAQTRLTEAAGGAVVPHAVDSLTQGTGALVAAGAWGQVTAARVLVATGAFGSELLGTELDVDRRPRTVLLAEAADDPRLPGFICAAPPDERLEEIYWVPPVMYPDGRRCLKIGGALRHHHWLEPSDLVDWFHSDGSSEEAEALEHTLRSLLPDTRFTSMATAPCVITGTPTGHPYIGWINDHVAVAIGGNGSAAKSSDELGRLAASLFDADGWSDSIDPDVFAPVHAGEDRGRG